MSGPRTCRAFVVAGPSSGTGKTTVALGLMAALRARGLTVQPFKCGPDFIDPGHHTRVCRRPSRNLDTWMVSDEANRRAFHRHAATADVSVIEGVMGLFDGARGSGAGSTAATASLLGVPIVLVVDASGMGASAAAVVKGFATFDSAVSIAGVIFNRVASASHYQLLLEACESVQGVTPLGTCRVILGGTFPSGILACLPLTRGRCRKTQSRIWRRLLSSMLTSNVC